MRDFVLTKVEKIYFWKTTQKKRFQSIFNKNIVTLDLQIYQKFNSKCQSTFFHNFENNFSWFLNYILNWTKVIDRKTIILSLRPIVILVHWLGHEMNRLFSQQKCKLMRSNRGHTKSRSKLYSNWLLIDFIDPNLPVRSIIVKIRFEFGLKFES